MASGQPHGFSGLSMSSSVTHWTKWIHGGLPNLHGLGFPGSPCRDPRAALEEGREERLRRGPQGQLGWGAACRLRLRDTSTLERHPCAGWWQEDSGRLPRRPTSRNQLEEPLLLVPRTPLWTEGSGTLATGSGFWAIVSSVRQEGASEAEAGDTHQPGAG